MSQGTLPSSSSAPLFHVPEIGRKSTSGIAKVGPGKMAAPLELSCWGGGWGLPSVHSESLVVMVRPPRGPGRGKRGAGPDATGWLGRVPAACSDSPRRCRAQAGRGAAPCSQRMSYNLACDSSETWRETYGFFSWLHVILSLAKLSEHWSESTKQGACAPRSANPGSFGEQGSQKPGSGRAHPLS